MVNSEELIDTIEYMKLYMRCCINRLRFKRVRLYIYLFTYLCIQFCSI
jgi:hypothetical protein